MTHIPEKRLPALWLRRLFTLVLSAWTALLIFHLVGFFFYTTPHQDQTWLLYAAQRVLAGAQIYGPQVVETNPPLIVWLSTVPVLLAHLLHLDLIVAFKLIVAAPLCGSVAWSGRILRAAGLAISPPLYYIALYSIFSAEVFLSGYDAGQREHLLIILVMPYVVAAICGPALKLRRAEFCALGVAAGLAVCLKPQQVLILIGLELFLGAWTRSLRRLLGPPLVAAFLTVVAYILVVRLAAPLYFSAIVPILRQTYWAFGTQSAWSLIKSRKPFDLAILLILAVFLWRRRTLRFPIATGALLACSFSASIAFDLQHAGFSYQFDPQRSFLVLAALSLVADLCAPYVKASIASWRFDSFFAAVTVIFVIALVPALIYSGRRTLRYDLTHQFFPAAVFAQYPPQTPVFVFSTDLRDAFPAVFHDHLVWASRFAHLWMLPAIVENQIAEGGGRTPRKALPTHTVNSLAALQRTETTQDFQRWKPAVVIVRRCSRSIPCQAMHKIDFDPLPWFLQSPAFAAEWKSYRFVASHDNYDVYTRIP